MKTKNININMDMFIIPNSCGNLSDFWVESCRKRVAKICDANGIEGDPKCIEVWLLPTDDETILSDNISAGFTYNDADGKRYYGYGPSHLPYPLIKDWKEGGEYTAKLVMTAENVETDEEIELDINATIHPKQMEYRYRFGTFEEVLGKLVKKDDEQTANEEA